MARCVHKDFMATVEIHRLYSEEGADPDSMPDGFGADIRAWCQECNEPLIFFGQGLPVGLLRDRPALSADGKELHVPCRPESMDPHHGLGLAGFIMRAQGADPSGN